MKKNSNRTVWLFWLPLGFTLAIFLIITIVGNILVVGSKLGTYNSTLELCFYTLLGIVTCWLIAFPLFSVLGKPVLALEDVISGNSGVDYKKLRKVAKELKNANVLPVEQQTKLAGAIGLGSSIREPLAEAINIQIESSAKIIRTHAVGVFVSTAISQNGKLDAIAVLIANFRLVHSLVIHFGYRPPLQSLIAVYAQIFMATFIADQLDDLNTENFLNKVGLGAVSAVPGAAVFVNSMLDGSINAIFTLRVGFITRKYLLNAGNELVRGDVQKNANLLSRQELIPVLKESLPALPAGIKQMVKAVL